MINKLHLSNWMGHENLNIEFKPGKNLIYGRNASGKSSIAKAIAYCLTGNMPVNCNPRKDTSVESSVDLSISTTGGENYIIRRQLRKGDTKEDEIFIYDESNPSEELYTSIEAENFIQGLLGMSGDIFERIIYMKEEDVHEFLAKPGGRVLNEIDRLIGLDKAHKIDHSLNVFSKELDGQKKSFEKVRKETEIAVRRSMGVEKSKADVKKIDKRFVEISTTEEELFQLKGYVEEREKLNEKLQRIKDEIKEQSVAKLEPKLITLMKTTNNKIKTVDKEISIVLEKKNSLEAITARKHAKAGLKNDIVRDIRQDKDSGEISECPTCGREMDEKLAMKTILKLEKEIKDIELEIGTQITKVNVVKQDIEKKGLKSQQLSKSLDRLKEMKTNASQLHQDFVSNESLINQFKSKKYPLTTTDIDEELDKLDKEKDELILEKGKAEGAKKVTEKQVVILQENEEKAKHQLKITELISKAILRTSETLRKEYSDEVKNLAETIWEQYKGEPWEIKWDKKFVPLARSRTSERVQTAYEMSGSERFLLLLAIRIAFQQTLDQFNLLIIDEPCQHLDETNGTIIRDILTSIDEEKISQSIIFTYNKEYLKGKWSNIKELT